jgi:hypothetical protein
MAAPFLVGRKNHSEFSDAFRNLYITSNQIFSNSAIVEILPDAVAVKLGCSRSIGMAAACLKLLLQLHSTCSSTSTPAPHVTE